MVMGRFTLLWATRANHNDVRERETSIALATDCAIVLAARLSVRAPSHPAYSSSSRNNHQPPTTTNHHQQTARVSLSLYLYLYNSTPQRQSFACVCVCCNNHTTSTLLSLSLSLSLSLPVGVQRALPPLHSTPLHSTPLAWLLFRITSAIVSSECVCVRLERTNEGRECPAALPR